MAQRKTERLMNLIFTLLVSRQYLTKDQIRHAIADYRESSDQAFERKFERDKEELREMGIAVETGGHDPLFGDGYGYRIRRDEAELPDLELTREEAAVLGLAAQVWEHAGLAGESSGALVKLKAAGVEIDPSILRMAEPRLSTQEPAFDAVWDATTRRVPIGFDYTRPGQPNRRRRLQPWGIISWRDRWYVGGWDLDRSAERLFRVSRLVGDPEPIGEPGSYTVPDDVDMRRIAAGLFPPEPDRVAVLKVRPGRAVALRRRAQEMQLQEIRDDDPQGGGPTFDQLVLPYASGQDLAAEIAGYAADVRVLEPPELREAVVARLRRAVEQPR